MASFRLDKCYVVLSLNDRVLLIRFKGNPLEVKSTLLYLGVHFHRGVGWFPHLSNVHSRQVMAEFFYLQGLYPTPVRLVWNDAAQAMKQSFIDSRASESNGCSSCFSMQFSGRSRR
jgi:hypothetical protein